MSSLRLISLGLAVLCGCRSASQTALRDVPTTSVTKESVVLLDSQSEQSQSEQSLPDEPIDELIDKSPSSLDLHPVTPARKPQSQATHHEADTAPNALPDVAVPVIAVSMSQPVLVPNVVSFEQVIQSLHQSYPLIQAALQERALADGNQVAAWGEFDTKLKAASENGPVGFYQTYRNSAGIETPLYGGGEVFAGYRNGAGSFQPWYQERETNDGGEFKAGARVPLIRDRDIDARRASLWRATYGQQIADPIIRSSLVEFSREGGLAYWKWVATGQKYKVGKQWVELAESRNDQIKRRVELQDLDPPELVDNERAIAKREAKLADALRELQQAAIKLSLFLRDENGTPYVPSLEEMPPFPELRDIHQEQLDADVLQAQQNRPELSALNLQLQQLRVDYSEACNMTLPGLDAQLVGSQDVGKPTSSKRDKSEFELEAGLFFDVPVERRKGRGKMYAVRAKMSQVIAKRNMVQDKVTAEVRFVYAALKQTQQETLLARRAFELASEMARIERRKFELGESDLLKVVLREQYALEAAEEEIEATFRHFAAFTDYAASLAVDRPTEALLPALASP